MTDMFGLKMLPGMGGQLFDLANAEFGALGQWATKNNFDVNAHSYNFS